MAQPEVILHDDPPPEWPDATVEVDLSYAAAAGGFTHDDTMAEPGDLIDPAEATGLTSGTDDDVIERTRAWLASRPETVSEGADDGS